ncbi:hypothetical protein Cni_G09825 [Canna indica]|uniref:Uncharacterized protein n=1 Tax=Canna indica TaxID=4628 RepID=A0AAQ3K6E3_9LILI|nr:hypothetical protein Cni_G09825 [Canna indica]
MCICPVYEWFVDSFLVYTILPLRTWLLWTYGRKWGGYLWEFKINGRTRRSEQAMWGLSGSEMEEASCLRSSGRIAVAERNRARVGKWWRWKAREGQVK